MKAYEEDLTKGGAYVPPFDVAYLIINIYQQGGVRSIFLAF